MPVNVIRGYGLLEGFLAKQRSKAADGLIPSALRKGRILDIGCGTYPLFLSQAEFAEKYGADKVMPGNPEGLSIPSINLINYDMEREDKLPFEDGYFNVVTMLAVWEHLEAKSLSRVLSEICRILVAGGMYIITTPPPWTEGFLRLLAKLSLISPLEIQEHKCTWGHNGISSMLQRAGFPKDKFRCGYFEMFMNSWFVAIK